jgi:hypothetical protein
MAWQLYTDPEYPFVQWVDGERADACFAYAADLCKAAALARLDGQGWERQRDRVLEAARWLGLGYRYCTLRPWIDPALRAAWQATYGREPQARVSTAGGAIAQRAARALAAMGERGEVGKTVIRVRLDQNGLVEQFCTESRNVGSGECDFKGLFSGCGDDGRAVQGCDPYTWQSLAWRGGVDAFNLEGLTISPPLRWSCDWIGDVARACAARGWRGVIREARLNMVILNAREAEAMGVELPADLAALASRAGVSGTVWPDPQLQAIGGSIAAAAGLLALIPTPFTHIAGLILGLVGAAVTALPGARGGLGGDLWGRVRPVFETPWIAGSGPGDGDKPTWSGPVPPAIAGAAAPPLSPLALPGAATLHLPGGAASGTTPPATGQEQSTGGSGGLILLLLAAALAGGR